MSSANIWFPDLGESLDVSTTIEDKKRQKFKGNLEMIESQPHYFTDDGEEVIRLRSHSRWAAEPRPEDSRTPYSPVQRLSTVTCLESSHPPLVLSPL